MASGTAIGSRPLKDLKLRPQRVGHDKASIQAGNVGRLSVDEPMLGSTPILWEPPMTASRAEHPYVLPRPACTPAAIRAVLAANAGPEVLQRYDRDLDAAFEQAREHGDLAPL